MFVNVSGLHVVVLLAVVILIVGIVAAGIATIKDPTMHRAEKIFWLAVLVFLPFAGVAVWGLSRVVNRRRNSVRPKS